MTLNKIDSVKPIPSKMKLGEFLSIFGSVYENSPWIAETAFINGINESHDDPESLSNFMSKVVNSTTFEKKLALLKSHPELAGKLAQSGEMTEDSIEEQSSAGLNNCSSTELQKFKNLNIEYKNKFGFPFILAVRGYNRFEILDFFEQRIQNDRDIEFEHALTQVNQIAAMRITNIMGY